MHKIGDAHFRLFGTNCFRVETEYKIYCWELALLSETQKFGFIKRVDKGWITTVKDLES